MSRLTKHINTSYLAAANSLASKHRGSDIRTIYVYVEGYDDIAFWRDVLEEFETRELRFEINVPARNDLAKGKKVLLNMLQGCGENMILCMDSDFDYLLGNYTEQSRLVNGSPYIFQTYVYSIENFLCYPPGLREACVKATKNDSFIFDFEKFMEEYSQTIYPLFLWYIYSAANKHENMLTRDEFRSSVRINFLTLPNDGSETIEWLTRQVRRKQASLERKYPRYKRAVERTAEDLKRNHGVTERNIYLYMHGHTLFDNVILIATQAVCDALRTMTLDHIRNSTREGVSLNNEYSNYKNALRDIREVLFDNDTYKHSSQFQKIHDRVKAFLEK